MLKFYKMLLLLILTACSLGSYGQEYELDTIYRAESVDTLPVSRYDGSSLEKLAKRNTDLLSTFNPHLDGTVVVSFIVFKDGNIADVKVVQSSDPSGFLDNNTIAYTNSFTLKPAIKDGRPVNVRVEVPFEFHPKDNNDKKEERSKSKYPHRHYYLGEEYAFFCGRFYVSGQLGAFGVTNTKKADFLKHDGGDGFSGFNFQEYSAGKIFRDRRRIGFSAGLGFRTMRYFFDKAFSLKTSTNEVYADYSAVETDNFRKHFLRISQLTLPLGMSYRFSVRTKDIGRFPVEVNIYATGTMRCQSYDKLIYKIDGVKKKLINKDDFLLRRFGCDFSIEWLFVTGMGFRYTISPLTMFDSGVNPKVYCHSCTFSFKIGIR
ncbi:MAG: energy transducer TonB [Bacteroidales bacterium]|nr:energy transducer TonB [Bacteroidales bacterium]